MLDMPDRSSGEQLGLAQYRAEFREKFWNIPRDDFWKLERQQTFTEHGDDSWEAFVRGDWELALALLARRRASYEEEARRMRASGITSYRVRIVEQPFTPYLQWELHSLHLMGAISDEVRVIDASRIHHHETDAVLPELVTVGPDVTYQVLYDDAGALAGAIRWTGTEITSTCRQFITGLYETGEDIGSYFDREVAPLPPPSPGR